MGEIEAFMATYGYGTLFALGLAEFAAFPVATIPVLVVAGAFAASGTLSVPGVVTAVAAGGLVADVLWLLVSRRFGTRLVHFACGMSPVPSTCVLEVERNVSRMGAPYLVVGKFLPGIAPMLAAAAGLGGMGLRRFLVVDAIALLVWASAYASLGWLFSGELEAITRWLAEYLFLLVPAVLVAGIGTLYARIRKVRAHRRAHGPRAPCAQSTRQGGWSRFSPARYTQILFPSGSRR